MNLLSCTLQFENSSQFYRPGEVIKGLVIVTVDGSSPILIKGLSILFAGFAFCKWEKPQKSKDSGKPKAKEFYQNREDYISTTTFLHGSDEANPNSLLPGVYKYNFMVKIPSNAPSTFESPLGSIRYSLEVYAHFSGYNECLQSHLIKVEQLKDLRRLGAVGQTLTEKEELEHKSCLKFWKHPLQLYISVPQAAYAVGECISIHIKISNYGQIKLKDITFKLNRIVCYQGSIKERKPQTISDVTTIACNVHTLFGQNSSVIQHLQQIYVPNTSSSQEFSECKCISVSYELEVTVCAQKHDRSIRAVLPIVVGSISLTSDVKIIEESSAVSNHVATIAVARSMDDLNLPSRLDLEEQNQMAFQQMGRMSASTISLASSFKEADYMVPVKLNKKSKCQLTGDPVDFKPKYLYYDLPEELHTNLHDDLPSSSNVVMHNSMASAKT